MNAALLLAPGPVALHPEVRRILALPMIHHRTPEFDQTLARVLQNIKKIFQTQEPVYFLTSTGSGGMEALLVNTLSPGDHVIAIVSGKFGERWAQMAEALKTQVTVVPVPWGEAVKPQLIQELLQKNPNTRAVLCQACETSTATAHPIEALGKIISAFPETLLLVDAITALGAYPLPMDKWKIDGLVGGSQKAFMLPTGMSFVALSKKAQAYLETAQSQRFYFDLRKEKKANASGETFYSSNVALIRALDWVLQDIESKSLARHFHEIHRRADFIRQFAVKLGFALYSKAPADSVTALLVPASMDGQKIRAHLEEKYQITIMGGQDQAKGKIIRIGHMGFIQDQEQIQLIRSLGKVLHDFDPHFLSLEQVEIITQDAQHFLGTHP